MMIVWLNIWFSVATALLVVQYKTSLDYWLGLPA